MPTNVSSEYSLAEKKYGKAKTREEKINALEEMISTAPSHKGGENLRMQLKTRLSKLREQKTIKTAKKSIAVPKEGEAQIAIIGTANVGKSTLLNKLTGSKVKVADYPYTTVEPAVGIMYYNDVPLQIVEIPSTFTPEMIGIAKSADVVVGLVATDDDRQELKTIIDQLKRKVFWLNRNNDIETIKRKMWEYTGLIHLYTKTPGRKKDLPAITFYESATVKDVANRVHKDFVKKFRFARIFGPSAKFKGQQVGLDHKLKDGDVVEIHIE